MNGGNETNGVLRQCQVCGGGDVARVDRYSPADWPLVSCNACGFVFLHKVPEYGALNDELAWEKTHQAENDRRKRRVDGKIDVLTRWRLGIGKAFDNLRQNQSLGRTGNVLDVGCGGGCRIPAGPTPFGIEISAELARRALPEFEARGGALHHGPAVDGMDAFPGVTFDAILMRSYLEHEANASTVLEKAFPRLKPDGGIFLRLPNYASPNRYVMGRRWCGFRFPDHVNYFTGSTLAALARRIGYVYERKNALSLFDDNLIVVLKRPASAKPQS